MIGQTISHYRILEKLGGGGMGVVYKAEDIRLHRLVALKFLTGEIATRPSGTRAAFSVKRRPHRRSIIPNICTVYDWRTRRPSLHRAWSFSTARR